MKNSMKFKPKYFICDVDGVMTTGHFLYSNKGKIFKIFGPHDHDGLNLIKESIKIIFMTADLKGFLISKKRIETDLGYPLLLIKESNRYQVIKNKYGLKNTIYMGDGYFDQKILKDCLYGIAPCNARKEAKASANFITSSSSGNGAVLDACLQIRKIFFK